MTCLPPFALHLTQRYCLQFAYQPFDSDLASLATATPPGTPWYYEISSWIGTTRATANCSSPAKVRVTQEELWTTSLIARSYGARGLSAFNFVYTRPYFDLACEFALNEPYSEPLFAALNRTKDVDFLACCADQLYRLGTKGQGSGHQIPAHGLSLAAAPAKTLRIVAVPPTGGWQKLGRLRLLGNMPVSEDKLSISLNGHVLAPTTNVSSQYSEGVQATMGLWPPSMWAAFDVPAAIMVAGNNSITLAANKSVLLTGHLDEASTCYTLQTLIVGHTGLSGSSYTRHLSPGLEGSYTLAHTGASAGGDSKRWRFPYPHTSSDWKGARIVGASAPGLSLMGCEQRCDADTACQGIYYGTGPAPPSSSGYALMRLELSLPVKTDDDGEKQLPKRVPYDAHERMLAAKTDEHNSGPPPSVAPSEAHEAIVAKLDAYLGLAQSEPLISGTNC